MDPEETQKLADLKIEINELIWRFCDGNMPLKEAEERACEAFRVISAMKVVVTEK